MLMKHQTCNHLHGSYLEYYCLLHLVSEPFRVYGSFCSSFPLRYSMFAFDPLIWGSVPTEALTRPASGVPTASGLGVQLQDVPTTSDELMSEAADEICSEIASAPQQTAAEVVAEVPANVVVGQPVGGVAAAAESAEPHLKSVPSRASKEAKRKLTVAQLQAAYHVAHAELRLEKAKQVAASAPAPVLPVKPADPRRPKTFSGEGAHCQTGAARRFLSGLQTYFKLAHIVSADQPSHAMLYLELSALDHMDTAFVALPAPERTWSAFCNVLNARFGTLDPDAEFRDKLHELGTQGTLTTAEYVHEMQACFNGILELPLSAGDMIDRFQRGLNPAVKRQVATAPVGMGVNGKWIDPQVLMTYAVMQSQALANHGATAPDRNGDSKKRSHDASTSSSLGAKKKGGNGHAPSLGASRKKPNAMMPKQKFRDEGQLKWLKDSNRCFHCTEQGHSSRECPKKQAKQPFAAMPEAFGKHPKA